MNDLEFEVLDELYFVVSFSQLQEATGIEQSALKECLQQLLEKKWVKCMASIDDELEESEVDMNAHFQQYYYLATKKGLMAHNTL
ncbi:hypothetical protein [Algivirga pacifica]|uniref:MarR family transcriptional regulator n=1 Tax=Algivirga pacifica TaxID=1162670 RepID=A0ABP9DJV5_9BACT